MKIPPLPPIYLVTGLAIIYCLHQFLPDLNLIPGPTRLAGMGLMVLSALLTLAAGSTLKQHKTTMAFGQSRCLVTCSIFRLSRNPMYLAIVLVLLGAALWSKNLLALLVPLYVFAALHLHLIPLEEKKMLQEFDQEYIKYKRIAPRWL